MQHLAQYLAARAYSALMPSRFTSGPQYATSLASLALKPSLSRAPCRPPAANRSLTAGLANTSSEQEGRGKPAFHRAPPKLVA